MLVNPKKDSMDLFAVRWPNGTYTVCVPGNERLPLVKRPDLWVGQGSDGSISKVLKNGIRVEGLSEWKWWFPGTIILKIPGIHPWGLLEATLREWLSEVFEKEISLQEVKSQ